MSKLSTIVGTALLSQVLTFGAYAQEQGPALQPPPAYHKATAEEKAAGKAQRRKEGRAAERPGNISSGEVTQLPEPQTKTPKATKAEREAARAARTAETKRAAKAGELAPTGEVGAIK